LNETSFRITMVLIGVAGVVVAILRLWKGI
jgi:hypothetical protein